MGSWSTQVSSHPISGVESPLLTAPANGHHPPNGGLPRPGSLAKLREAGHAVVYRAAGGSRELVGLWLFVLSTFFGTGMSLCAKLLGAWVGSAAHACVWLVGGQPEQKPASFRGASPPEHHTRGVQSSHNGTTTPWPAWHESTNPFAVPLPPPSRSLLLSILLLLLGPPTSSPPPLPARSVQPRRASRCLRWCSCGR